MDGDRGILGRTLARLGLVLLGLTACLYALLAVIAWSLEQALPASSEDGPTNLPHRDVSLVSCQPGADGTVTATGSIHNRSSETSDYAVHVVAGWTSTPSEVVTLVRGVRSGATVPWTATGDVGSDAPCRVKPDRVASASTDTACELVFEHPDLQRDMFGWMLDLCGVASLE